MTEPVLLTVKEYAARMRVGEETVRRWLRAGRLTARRTCEPHGHWRIYARSRVDDMQEREP